MDGNSDLRLSTVKFFGAAAAGAAAAVVAAAGSKNIVVGEMDGNSDLRLRKRLVAVRGVGKQTGALRGGWEARGPSRQRNKEFQLPIACTKQRCVGCRCLRKVKVPSGQNRGQNDNNAWSSCPNNPDKLWLSNHV